MPEAERVKERNTSTIQVHLTYQSNIIYLGYLYPDRDKLLTDADTYDKLKDAVRATAYEHMLS